MGKGEHQSLFTPLGTFLQREALWKSMFHLPYSFMNLLVSRLNYRASHVWI